MIQKDIRPFNNNTFTPEEAAEWLQELNARTESAQVGYNSINELAAKVKENNVSISGLTGGYQGILIVTDTPTDDGVYIPTEESADYINAGNLSYLPSTTDQGFDVTFIKSGATWTKKRVDLKFETEATPTLGSTKLVQSGGVANALKNKANLEISSNQIFNKDAEPFADGKFVNSLGALQNNSSFRTEKFDLIENQDIFLTRFSTGDPTFVAFVDANDVVLSTVSKVGNNNVFKGVANCSYILTCLQKTSKDIAIASYSSVEIAYESYKESIPKSEVQVTSAYNKEDEKTPINGKGVSVAISEVEVKLKSQKIDTSIVFENIAASDIANFATTLDVTDLGENGVRFYKTGTVFFPKIDIDLKTPFLPNHRYYLAINMTLVAQDSSASNFIIITPRAKSPTGVNESATGTKNKLVEKGTTGVLKVTINTNETLSNVNSNIINIDFGFNEAVEDIDFTIHGISVIDLGVIDANDNSEIFSYEEADNLISHYGYVTKVTNLDTLINPYKRVITGWGNSMMTDAYLTASGRNYVRNRYGGQTSTLIRDEYLASFDYLRNYTSVFAVGRNNMTETDYIIDDLRAMISKSNNPNFIIQAPQNGAYTTELKNGSSYINFTRLEERLQNAYPTKFFNIRKQLIDSYDFGGIKLTSSFIQPAINGNVQIEISKANLGTAFEVDGTAFLNTFNSSDSTTFPNEVDKITIGTLYDYDVYEIVSIDSSTLMTIKLLENNTSFAPTQTVNNPIDLESGTAIKYLKICQKLDVFMWENDVVQSTLRVDAIHRSDLGSFWAGNLLSKFLDNLGI